MDNRQAQVIANFRSLFQRYKATVTQNDRQYKIIVDNTSVEITKPRQKQTQQQSTKL